MQDSAVAMIAGKLPRCLDTRTAEDTASTETPLSLAKTPAQSSDEGAKPAAFAPEPSEVPRTLLEKETEVSRLVELLSNRVLQL